MEWFENLLHGGRCVDLGVEGGKIAAIRPHAPTEGEGAPMPVAPAFYNGHTHLAMSLLRGYADDLELMDWLQGHIWPAEAKLTAGSVYAGTRLAILEMIRSGTVFANDMYWEEPMVVRAAQEMGIRCAASLFVLEPGGDGRNAPRNVEAIRAMADLPRDSSERVFATWAPHAAYTVCEATLRSLGVRAREEGAFLHIHASETRGEVEACRKEHGGRTPVAYLADCGLLGPRTVLAHGVHLTDEDVAIIRDTGTVVCENQQSNMKLVSGLFPFRRAVEEGGCRAILGTDGCASNNSLSMFAEMKCAALAGKIEAGDPTAASADRIYRMATRGGAEAFGIDAGEIRVGAEADFLLLDPKALALAPGFNRTSDLVYAGETSCVDTVVCMGRTLMKGKRIEGEEEIVAAALAEKERLFGGRNG